MLAAGATRCWRWRRGSWRRVTAPALVYVGAKAISNSTAGKNALADVTPEQNFPQTPTAMLATVSAANELTSVTVFVLAPDADVTAAGYDQRGGSVVSVPINADAGSGEQPLSLHDAYALGGEQELRIDVESAINLTIDFTKVMTRQELVGLLGSLPPVEVELPRDVLGPKEDVLYPKGPVSLSTDQVAEIMTSKSPTEREHLRHPNINVLWAGIADALGGGRSAQSLGAVPPATFDELSTRLMAAPIASRGWWRAHSTRPPIRRISTSRCSTAPTPSWCSPASPRHR